MVLAGGREQTGPAALRRATGVAPINTTSVLSRWGSTLLFPGITATQLYYWHGSRYAYDGSYLYRDGVIIESGFNGTRLSFNSMPPQGGLDDYLFILGGGKAPFKIAPNGTVTNWGIQAPPNQMQANNQPIEQIVIDAFDVTAGNWITNGNCTRSSDTSEFIQGTASLKVLPTAAPWRIVNTAVATLNLGNYSPSGDISLETDVIQFWIFFNGNFNQTWIQLDFDVSDATFRNNYYSYVMGFISSSSSNPSVNHSVQVTYAFQQGQWQQITIPKSEFRRVGNALQQDWFNVRGVRLSGGGFANYALFDNLTMSGGCAMGAGPAVGHGGSEYDYRVVYRNLTTGSQSNPNSDPAKVFGVALNKVLLSNIPTSSDPQVNARDLYRTQALTVAGGTGTAFYLDTIYDNVTTTYLDNTADQSFRMSTTPWQPNVGVPPDAAAPYYIDAGNGYYFKLIHGGTTAAAPPTWIIPSSTWAANSAFVVGETVAPIQGGGDFFQCSTAGTSGVVKPNWAAGGAPLIDGTVTWTNIGLMTTVESTGPQWQYEGINSTPVLGNDAVLLDNAPPAATYTQAYGPFQGSMFYTGDTAAPGYIYASPPGRPEGVGQAYMVTGTDDPMQAMQEYDGVLWAFSQDHAFYQQGAYPAIAWIPVLAAHGTVAPHTVVRVPGIGIIYWAHDGIRILSWGSSVLIGFHELGPLFRGQAEENLPAWSYLNPPQWAARSKDEIVFSDGQNLTLAIAYDGLLESKVAWRRLSPVMTACYHDEQTGQIQASFNGNVYQYEQPGVLADGTAAIPFEIQSPADFPDPGAQFTTQRIYIAANLNVSQVAQNLIPVLIIDGMERTLPLLPATAGRTTYELAPQMCGRLFDGVRLTGSLTGRVEIFNISADVWLGEQQA
jgi:hypothetical protein